MSADDDRPTRRAPHMERFTQIRPYAALDNPDAFQLSLKVGNQSFLISDGSDNCHESKEAAEWARDMLCIALDRLVKGEAQ